MRDGSVEFVSGFAEIQRPTKRDMAPQFPVATIETLESWLLPSRNRSPETLATTVSCRGVGAVVGTSRLPRLGSDTLRERPCG
jgi:hypothetical protein